MDELLDEGIQFFWDDITEFDLDQQRVAQWIIATAQREKATIQSLNIIFCSDDSLLAINIDHLNHDYYTDIITFGYKYDPIVGELYISADRVGENATKLGIDFMTELRRVMIHGCLHLMGFDDTSEQEKTLIRAKENEYLLTYEDSSTK